MDEFFTGVFKFMAIGGALLNVLFIPGCFALFFSDLNAEAHWYDYVIMIGMVIGAFLLAAPLILFKTRHKSYYRAP